MPPKLLNVPLPDPLRYQILHSLDLENKVREAFIEKRVSDRSGQPAFIVPKGDLPIGTISQIVRYVVAVNGWELIKAHQYRLPDGTIKGGPDPLYIRLDDIVVTREERRKP